VSGGPELARDLLLLGAESAAQTPAERVLGADDPWPVLAERWEELRARMARLETMADPQRGRLCGELGLGKEGFWLVLLCIAVELYPESAAAASLLAEDERVHLLTPVVFARLLRQARGVPFGEALAEAVDGTPRRLGLLERSEAVPGRPLTQQPLCAAAAELACWLGPAGHAPAAPGSWVERQPPATGCAFDPALVRGALALLRERRVLCLRGASRRALRQLALDLASLAGTEALYVDAADALPPAAQVARLRGGLAVLDLTRAQAPRGEHPELYRLADEALALRSEAGDGWGIVVLLGAAAETRHLPTLAVEPLDQDACARIWRLAGQDEATGRELARRYRVDLTEVRGVVAEARDALRVAADKEAPSPADLARGVRAQGARRMGSQVGLVPSCATLDELVVPATLRRQLADVVGWYGSSARVFGEMGMGRSTRLGRGLVCLFSGPPGTGKTFAAQCLANALELNLYRIDLSQVVSKYIGETEKALAAVFDEAEGGHGILLFDEADSLFGRRSAIKDAHDRYANIEVGFLLQRLEAFEGVAILATNLRSNLDPAFTRRIRFLLDFPMPDRGARQRLWEQALPGAAHREPGLDVGALAERFRLSGGSIQSIGLAAAHLAASAPAARVSQRHLVAATYRELEKNGQPRSATEFGHLAELLPEEAA